MDPFVFHFSRSHNGGSSLHNSFNDTLFKNFEKNYSIIKTSKRVSTKFPSIINFNNWKTNKKLMKYVIIKWHLLTFEKNWTQIFLNVVFSWHVLDSFWFSSRFLNIKGALTIIFQVKFLFCWWMDQGDYWFIKTMRNPSAQKDFGDVVMNDVVA